MMFRLAALLLLAALVLQGAMATPQPVSDVAHGPADAHKHHMLAAKPKTLKQTAKPLTAPGTSKEAAPGQHSVTPTPSTKEAGAASKHPGKHAALQPAAAQQPGVPKEAAPGQHSVTSTPGTKEAGAASKHPGKHAALQPAAAQQPADKHAALKPLEQPASKPAAPLAPATGTRTLLQWGGYGGFGGGSMSQAQAQAQSQSMGGMSQSQAQAQAMSGGWGGGGSMAQAQAQAQSQSFGGGYGGMGGWGGRGGGWGGWGRKLQGGSGAAAPGATGGPALSTNNKPQAASDAAASKQLANKHGNRKLRN